LKQDQILSCLKDYHLILTVNELLTIRNEGGLPLLGYRIIPTETIESSIVLDRFTTKIVYFINPEIQNTKRRR
jgi:hypothetical protein